MIPVKDLKLKQLPDMTEEETKEFIEILKFSAPRMVEYFNIAKTRIDATEESVVSITDKQLSTQLPDDVQTTPDQKYEQGVMESIRNPDKSVKAKKSKKEKKVVEEVTKLSSTFNEMFSV